MKTRNEILSALARSGDDRLLLAGLLDKAQACQNRGYPTHTRFLDMNERALCAAAVRLAGLGGQSLFFGGYEEAERGIYLFYPDYMDELSAREAAPLALLRAHKRSEDTLTHRDYLGALMGLQIERSVLGDILVHKEGADLLVLADMADFLLENFRKAGRAVLSLTQEPLSALRQDAGEEIEGTGSVASLRLDSVTALVFRLSRGEAQSFIEKGQVFVNHVPVQKAERQIAEADRLTVRGLGRARITEIGGNSRKGRVFVKYAKKK